MDGNFPKTLFILLLSESSVIMCKTGCPAKGPRSQLPQPKRGCAHLFEWCLARQVAGRRQGPSILWEPSKANGRRKF